jgi:hypothetical protein
MQHTRRGGPTRVSAPPAKRPHAPAAKPPRRHKEERSMAEDLKQVVTLLVEGLRAMPGLTPATRSYVDKAWEALNPPAGGAPAAEEEEEEE